MLGYLSKFILQMLPTISATVIGAYIVATWINPKTPPEHAKVEARESADEAEAGKPAKVASGGPDNIRIIPIVKQRPSPEDASVSESAQANAAAHEGKDVNELARAAIQRLRGSTETTTAADHAAKSVAEPVREARAAPEAPVAAAASAPPLPPAVTIISPRYPQDEAADQAGTALPERADPPTDVAGARNPLSWPASRRVAESPFFAEDLASATRSLLRAITPPPLQDFSTSSQR